MSVTALPTPLQAIESELLSLAGHITAAEARFLQLLAESTAATAGPGPASAPAPTGSPGGPV